MTSGADHDVVPGPDDSLLRRRKEGSGSLTVTQEQSLLDIVRDVSPLPVPVIHRVWPDQQLMQMERIPGVALLTRQSKLQPVRLETIGASLGRFMATLAGVPLARLEGIVETDDIAHDDLLDEATVIYESHRDAIPHRCLRGVEAFLHEPVPPPPSGRCLTHHDLGAEHVLVDASDLSITGIIDWSDAAIADPALDLGLILRDLGPSAFRHAADAFVSLGCGSEGLLPRAHFYARVRALEDLAFGVEHDRAAYRDNAVRALDRLFPHPLA